MGSSGRAQRRPAADSCSLPDNFGVPQAGSPPAASPTERQRRSLALSPRMGDELRSASGGGRSRAGLHRQMAAAPAAPAAPQVLPSPGRGSPERGWPPANGGASPPSEPDESLIFAFEREATGARVPAAAQVSSASPALPSGIPSCMSHAAAARRGNIVETFKDLAGRLRAQQCQPGQPLHQALLEHYEGTERDVREEIDLALAALETVYALKNYIGPREGTLAAIMPQNMPLYSLVLYAIMPAILKDEVAVHLPEGNRPLFARIYRAVTQACVGVGASRGTASPEAPCGADGDDRAQALSLPHIGRVRWDVAPQDAGQGDMCLHDRFLHQWCKRADMFVVTGSFDAALNIMSCCPDSTLIIYNSSGINPAVVGANPPHPDTPEVARPATEVMRAIAKRLVKARMLHNGQDCGAPDAIFVHQDQKTRLVDAIKEELAERGDTGRQRTVRSVDKFADAVKFVADSLPGRSTASRLESDFQIDGLKQKMAPVIVCHELAKYRLPDNKLKICEFYAPIFNIFSYADESELSLYFGNSKYEETRMFVSVFGELAMASRLELDHTLLRDQTVIDFDNATVAYGGPGMRASGYILDQQIYPQAINPMMTIFGHQEARRAGKLGYSAVERTQLAHEAFEAVTESLTASQREGLLWSYFFQDGKKFPVGSGSRGKKTGVSHACGKENHPGAHAAGRGQAQRDPARPTPHLRSDAPLGVVFVVDKKNKRAIKEAVEIFLRGRRARGRSPSDGKLCVASYLAQAAGMPVHLSDRTYIVTTEEAGRALEMFEGKAAQLTSAALNVEAGYLQKALVVEAMGATARMGSQVTLDSQLQRELNRRARLCAPVLAEMVETLCLHRGDTLLANTEKWLRRPSPAISYAHCQSLLMMPQRLPVDASISPPGSRSASPGDGRSWRLGG